MEYRILAVEMVFRLPYAHSLKDKRQLRQSLRGRLEARWRLSVLECGSQDLWQRLELVAVMAIVGEQAARDRGEEILNFSEEALLGSADLIEARIEVL
ncbi:MAG: DUF503 domain-containing protein [Clostridiaceae bacterium]|nr:DUF503 domain-containing protein [Clostridiaceae bacterium]